MDPDEVVEKELFNAFHNYFEVEWSEILDVADKSFAYNAANDTYFSVCDLRLLENMTLEELLKQKEVAYPLNVIVS